MTRGDAVIKTGKSILQARAVANSTALVHGPTSAVAIRAKSALLDLQAWGKQLLD